MPLQNAPDTPITVDLSDVDVKTLPTIMCGIRHPRNEGFWPDEQGKAHLRSGLTVHPRREIHPMFGPQDGMVLYYPGCGSDYGPLLHFSQTEHVSTAVYVDYLMTRTQIIEMLQDLYRAAGTQGEGPKLFPLRGRDFGLTGWKEFWPESERSLMFGKPDTAFGVVCDLTLQPNRSTRLIFLRTEAHQTYCNLLNTTLRPNMVVLQDHGFGGNWQDFGNEESPMYLAALEQRALPPRLFVAESNTRPWPRYRRSGSELLLDGQMHQHQRAVYERIA